MFEVCRMCFLDAAFQSCPCPMQSCPKNVDTGPLIGNGKGAPVVSGPGLSLPPSALVGPPSPARGRAGLAPPHGANAWDTDRVQHNNHRSHKSQNQSTLTPANNHVAPHNHHQNSNCLSKVQLLLKLLIMINCCFCHYNTKCYLQFFLTMKLNLQTVFSLKQHLYKSSLFFTFFHMEKSIITFLVIENDSI